MTILTKEEREDMRERIDNSTKGPWFNWVENNAVFAGVAVENGPGSVSPSGEPIYEDFMSDSNFNGPNDAEFIAHARTDLPRALDTIDALEAERNEWVHRAEAAEATQDAVAMRLGLAMDAFEDGDDTLGRTWVARAAHLCPPAEEARERTRKAAELFDQILHPNGRCECAGEGLCDWCSKECEMCGTQRCVGCGCDSECLGCRDYAERMAELEAERDALRSALTEIRTYATQQSSAYGASHAGRVMRRVADMAGGEE